MASSGKKKTTMAKLNRERKLRERRIDKKIKKDARKHASDDGQSTEELTGDDQAILAGTPESDLTGDDQATPAGTPESDLDAAFPSPADV